MHRPLTAKRLWKFSRSVYTDASLLRILIPPTDQLPYSSFSCTFSSFTPSTRIDYYDTCNGLHKDHDDDDVNINNNNNNDDNIVIIRNSPPSLPPPLRTQLHCCVASGITKRTHIPLDSRVVVDIASSCPSPPPVVPI